jgi:hypothetical protein
MVSTFRAAAFAMLFCLAAVHPAGAQQQPAPGASETDGYKPPARFITKDQKPGAAKPVASAQAATAGPVKSIGLISVLGETFTVKRVGIMVFGNEEHKIPISGWKIDDQIAALVATSLKKTFKVKPIRVPEGAYEKFASGSFIFTSRTDELAKFIASHAASVPCDYYLVIGPNGDRVASSNQIVSGLGVLRMESIFGDKEFIHAYAWMQVYDSKFVPLRSKHSLTIDFNPLYIEILRGPHAEMKEGNRLPTDAKAAVADPRTRKITMELLEPSLAKMLPQLFAAN